MMKMMKMMEMTGEEEVMDALEELQMTQEEKEALKELEEYTEKMKDTGEYEDMTGELDKEITEKYDELEMIYDMNAYECEEDCHDLMRKNPFEGRDWKVKDGKEGVSKQSRMMEDVEIKERGDNYGTGLTKYGKVYIPKAMLNDISGENQRILIQFKGFGDCRGNQMPWRALKIVV